ncbi:MarR family winged helix-turn-helix transcriptional regulator [uncultured Sphingomonas sp.]|uniref:MarR family winged helix-turn-helix transcriptional regulator n=1 Tax=uncultured Sphingomonas sp. TaxID=158754 RepID=UPI0035CB38B3
MTMNEEPWYQQVAMPALLRHARTAYGAAMRHALAEAGYDDVPPNGLYLIGGLALGKGEVVLGDLLRQLRLSKQSAGQLVDTLVVRGYLDRGIDPADSRKLNVTLTARGQAAAVVQGAAREMVDAELLAGVGPQDVERTRRTLAMLVDIARRRGGGDDD